MRPRTRALLNLLNLATPMGLAVARAGGATARRTSDGLIVARGYRLPVPPAPAFTVGNVILLRERSSYTDNPWDSLPSGLRAHEVRHATQYAVCGGVLMPVLYLAASGWSWLRTGDFASRNVFERDAGLLLGGYREQPIRPLWAAAPMPFASRSRAKAGARSGA